MSTKMEQADLIRTLEVNHTANEFTREISDSLILRHNWGNLLSAAPLALGFIGACQIVASSPTAAGLKLQRPTDGFKHLKWHTLQANIVLLNDTGRLAFLDAEKRMGQIAMRSKYIFSETGVANRIIHALHDESSAAVTLPKCMDDLRNLVDECKADVQMLESEFEDWLGMASELHQAASESIHETSDKHAESQEKLSSQEIREKAAFEERKNRELAVEEAKRRMALAEKAFERAANSIPTGWDAIGMSFVEGLSSTVLTIGSSVATFFTAAPYVSAASSLLGAAKTTFLQTPSDQSPGNGMNQSNSLEYGTRDPAIDHLDSLIDCLTGLHLLIGGADRTGPDWKELHQKDSSNKTPITWWRTNLEIIKEHLDKNPSPGSFSYDTEKIVAEALQVIKELDRARKDEKTLSPSVGQNQITDWKKSVFALKVRSLSLQARKNQLPGLAAGAKPPKLNSPKTNDTRAKSITVVQTQIEAAAANYQAAAASMDAQRAAFDASNQKLVDNLVKIHEIQESISKLKAENITLEDIVKVLRASIAALSGLKAQIAELLRFFQDLSAMVDFVASGPCKSLLRTLESGIGRETSSVVAGITYGDFQRQILLNSIFMIRGYFNVVTEISRLYTEVSHDYIMPGINLVCQLGLSQNPDTEDRIEMERRNQQLVEYRTQALAKIKELAKKKQDALLSRMDKRMEDIRQTTAKLPASSETKFIKESLEREVVAATAAIELQPMPSIEVSARILTEAIDDDL